MGRTSNEAKRRYNNKAYEAIAITAYRGAKEQIKEAAAKAGQSLTQYILEAVASRMQSEGQPLQLRKWNDESED